jgi:hypothetical protein
VSTPARHPRSVRCTSARSSRPPASGRSRERAARRAWAAACRRCRRGRAASAAGAGDRAGVGRRSGAARRVGSALPAGRNTRAPGCGAATRRCCSSAAGRARRTGRRVAVTAERTTPTPRGAAGAPAAPPCPPRQPGRDARSGAPGDRGGAPGGEPALLPARSCVGCAGERGSGTMRWPTQGMLWWRVGAYSGGCAACPACPGGPPGARRRSGPSSGASGPEALHTARRAARWRGVLRHTPAGGSGPRVVDASRQGGPRRASVPQCRAACVVCPDGAARAGMLGGRPPGCGACPSDPGGLVAPDRAARVRGRRPHEDGRAWKPGRAPARLVCFAHGVQTGPSAPTGCPRRPRRATGWSARPCRSPGG